MRALIIQITREDFMGACFEQVLTWLEAVGLTLPNPFNNAVTYFDDIGDDDGQLRTTAEEVVRKLHHMEPGSVQMWFSAGVDVFISWTATEMRIYLDGKNAEEKRKVLNAVFGNFAEICDGPGAGWKICVGNEDMI